MSKKPLGTDGKRLGAEEWSRFWERGTLTTFEGHFRENYDAEIRDFWWSQFSLLADGAAIVDLATGNGAVALLAARFAREQGRRFEITGIDSARIDPQRVRAAWPALTTDLEAIKLHGGVPLEATGLPAGSADLVTSQYGFEYGDSEAGSREIVRILRPGGRLAVIAHHDRSAILSQAREGLRQVTLCMDEERLTRLGRLMSKLIRGLKPGSQRGRVKWTPGAIKVREDLRAAAARLERHARLPDVRREDAGFIEFAVPAVLRLVEQSRAIAAADLEQAWGAIDAEAEAYRLRMSDLVSAAWAEDDLARVRREMAAVGLEDPATGALWYKGDILLGWTLTTRKC